MHGSEPLVLGLKIVAMFLVIAVGFWGRRRGMITADSTAVMARLCTDVTLPALIFVQMVQTVDLSSLHVGWALPLLAVAGICLGWILAWLNWRLFAKPSQAPVFLFCSGISNWIYLPLPMVLAIYGQRGSQALFLCNLGLQPLFWSMGVAILHGGKIDSRALKHVAANPGLIATVAGIAVAVACGLSGQVAADFAGQEPWKSLVDILRGGLETLGSATIPVSLLVTGAQIATATMVQSRPTGAILGVALNRLIFAPLISIAGLVAIHAVMPAIPVDSLLVVAIVLLMPVSVTSTVLTEKMNQDTALAAQAVLYTTLASILTVPPLFMLAQKALG